ncbi:hypothetical protein ACFLQT_00200 [Bacteroidota bacterium]
MKKGCFLSAVVIITFTTGVVFYIIENHGDKFTDFGKEKLIQLAEEGIEENIDKLEESRYQDSLRFIISEYIENVDEEDFEEAMEKISDFFNEIDSYIEDQEIDSVEFDILKNIADDYERY